MAKTSVIIVACNELFLRQTIQSVLDAARGDIEVIVVLDNYWPNPPLPEFDRRVNIIHLGKRQGLRPGIMAAARIATGKYIMKLDAHCLLDEGFDVKLAADCEHDWVVIPRRYRLDPDAWKINEIRGYIDYMFLDENYIGKIWLKYDRARNKQDVMIDDLMTFQGSCWFMHKDYFWKFGGYDPACGAFFHEAQILGFRTWLSGGRVVRNKNTWYAHLHKGRRFGRMYRLDKGLREVARQYLQKTWIDGMNGPFQIYPLSWLIDKFEPVPGWHK